MEALINVFLMCYNEVPVCSRPVKVFFAIALYQT